MGRAARFLGYSHPPAGQPLKGLPGRRVRDLAVFWGRDFEAAALLAGGTSAIVRVWWWDGSWGRWRGEVGRWGGRRIGVWHGVAGRGAAGRSGGWRTGIRNPGGGDVMASVYLLNTSVKFSICREPAGGCGREVVGRGWVCLVVHGVWGRGFARRPWCGPVPGRSACCSRG